MRIFIIAGVAVILSSCAIMPAFQEVATIFLGPEPQAAAAPEAPGKPFAASGSSAAAKVVVIELEPIPDFELQGYLADAAEPQGREIAMARFVDPGYLADGILAIRQYVRGFFVSDTAATLRQS